MPKPDAEMAVVCDDPEPTPTRPIVIGGQGRDGPEVEGAGVVVFVARGLAAFLVGALVALSLSGVLS